MKLHVTRLRVEQLRRFREGFELRDLAPGLNLITGANEAGKSSLVRALRAAFFERHRSTTVEDLRPFDEPAAAPEVQLDFTLDGGPHRLVKRFLNRKRCLLDLPNGQQLEGAEAEDWLAQQWGFQFALRGGSRPEHWGVPGLLWVEQGLGHELDEAAKHARGHLHEALQQLSQAVGGSLVATSGDAVLADLQAQRALLLTDKGRARGALQQAQEAVQSQQTLLDELDGRITQYRQQVDMLAGLQARQALEDEQRPWDSLTQQLTAARLRHAEITELAQQRTELQQRQQLCRQEQALWQSQQQALQQQNQALRQRENSLLACAARLAPARAQVEQLGAVLHACSAQLDQARTVMQRARLADQRHQVHQQWQDAQQARLRDEEALNRAQTEQQRLDTLRAQLAAVHIDPAVLQRLVRLERTHQDGVLRRQAAATRLQFQLPDGQKLRVDMQPPDPPRTLLGEGEFRLDQAITVHLPGGGWLHLEPGGSDWHDWARQERRTHDELAAALHQAGVASVAQAQEWHAHALQLQQQMELAAQALAWIAPQGLEALREAVAQARAREHAAQQQWIALPPEEEATSVPSRSEAEARFQHHQRAEQQAQTQLQQAREQLIGCERDHANALHERDVAWAALNDPAHAARHDEVILQLRATQHTLDELTQRLTTLQAQWQAAQPERVRQDIERLERSLAQLDATRRQRQLDIARIEASLHQAGALGLEEERGHVAGELARAQQRHAELSRRAQALDGLCQRLLERRQAALVRLQTPLQTRLRHYLDLWMPEAELHLDEQLTPVRLTRPSLQGVAQRDDFGALSFGAREQLALIARLAYADVLQEAGRPTLLLLDDVLAHSDPHRLARMKPVLYDAATRHQVLLFSCHPEQWHDLGVPALDLDWLPRASTSAST